MTQNQIAYHALQETIRSNKAREEETIRSNKAREAETFRSNLEKEADTDYINRAQKDRWEHQSANDYIRNIIYAGDTIGRTINNFVNSNSRLVKSQLLKGIVVSHKPTIQRIS